MQASGMRRGTHHVITLSVKLGEVCLLCVLFMFSLLFVFVVVISLCLCCSVCIILLNWVLAHAPMNGGRNGDQGPDPQEGA